MERPLDIVIPFHHSINNDEELRYALRSAEQYIPRLGNVYIIGDVPAWMPRNVIMISAEHTYTQYHYRDRNIHNKIMQACKIKELSDQFIVMHDDNFLLQTFNPEEYLHKGKMWVGEGQYAMVEGNTRYLFGEHIQNYDVHCMHQMNKNRYVETVGRLDWSIAYGYCIKTAYAVLNGIIGTYCSDCKIQVPWDEDVVQDMLYNRAWFSIGDSAWKGAVKNRIKNLYSLKSKFE